MCNRFDGIPDGLPTDGQIEIFYQSCTRCQHVWRAIKLCLISRWLQLYVSTSIRMWFDRATSTTIRRPKSRTAALRPK